MTDREQQARLRRTAALNLPVAGVLLGVGLPAYVLGDGGLHTLGVMLAGAGGGMVLMLVLLGVSVIARRGR